MNAVLPQKSHRTMSIAERFEMRRAAKKAQSSPKPTKRFVCCALRGTQSALQVNNVAAQEFAITNVNKGAVRAAIAEAITAGSTTCDCRFGFQTCKEEAPSKWLFAKVTVIKSVRSHTECSFLSTKARKHHGEPRG